MLLSLAPPVAYLEQSLHKNGPDSSAKLWLKDAKESFVTREEQLYTKLSLPQLNPNLYQSVPAVEVISRRLTLSTTEVLSAATPVSNLFHCGSILVPAARGTSRSSTRTNTLTTILASIAYKISINSDNALMLYMANTAFLLEHKPAKTLQVSNALHQATLLLMLMKTVTSEEVQTLHKDPDANTKTRRYKLKAWTLLLGPISSLAGLPQLYALARLHRKTVLYGVFTLDGITPPQAR